MFGNLLFSLEQCPIRLNWFLAYVGFIIGEDSGVRDGFIFNLSALA